MKKISLTAVALLIIFAFVSCEKAPEEQIIGTWKVSGIESTANMNEEEAVLFEDVIEEQKRMLSYTFEQDRMLMTYDDQEFEWNWLLTQAGDSLKLNISNEDRQLEYFVKELNKDKMVWVESVFDEYFVSTSLQKADD